MYIVALPWYAFAEMLIAINNLKNVVVSCLVSGGDRNADKLSRGGVLSRAWTRDLQYLRERKYLEDMIAKVTDTLNEPDNSQLSRSSRGIVQQHKGKFKGGQGTNESLTRDLPVED